MRGRVVPLLIQDCVDNTDFGVSIEAQCSSLNLDALSGKYTHLPLDQVYVARFGLDPFVFSLNFLWCIFSKMLKTFIRDFVSYCHDGIMLLISCSTTSQTYSIVDLLFLIRILGCTRILRLARLSQITLLMYIQSLTFLPPFDSPTCLNVRHCCHWLIKYLL